MPCAMRPASPLLAALLLAACGSAASPPAGAAEPEPSPPAASEGHAGHGAHHGFGDVERFARIFDDPARDAWQRPDDVVAMLELEAGHAVADLGAGTGYFLGRLAAAVGEEGSVLGLDIEPAMVAHMRERAAREGWTRVEAREVDAARPGLDPASVDRVLIVDTWHHLPDRVAYAAALREALRPGGFVLVVDFTLASEMGPPPGMRMGPEEVSRELELGGFATEILAEELPNQYVIRARPGRTAP
jgi:SAM-dependent methyltransferase